MLGMEDSEISKYISSTLLYLQIYIFETENDHHKRALHKNVISTNTVIYIEMASKILSSFKQNKITSPQEEFYLTE